MSKMIGVDVGGTFTDIFVLDEATGLAQVAKVPTSRPDQSAGFLSGINSRVDDLSTVSVVVHGTTAGTNALLERKGAKIGVITTEGLRDVLEMRRRDRPRTWGLRGDFTPVVDRAQRLEVPERTLADGTIRTPVDLDAVREAARALIADDCLAVAILFANAYANPENEAKAVEAVRAIWPNAHVSCSSEILPEIREFERFSTTALNAYLQPEVSGYLGRLEKALKNGGFAGEFMIVQSNGGVMDVDTAVADGQPAPTLDLSGFELPVLLADEGELGAHEALLLDLDKASKGKTAGRGTKGTKARYQVPARFEGGQMPLHMRLPKLRGFTNPFRVEYQVVNLDKLGELFPAGGEVTIEDLVKAGAVRKDEPVKILGSGEITVALQIEANRFSASAKDKIVAAGGTATQI